MKQSLRQLSQKGYFGHASLFGWVGASDKHLEKYSNLFHTLNIPVTYRTVAPTLDAFFFKDNLVPLAKGWLEKLCSHPHERDPGVLFVASNGGAWLYHTALKLLREDSSLPLSFRKYSNLSLGAIIYDSAPVFETPHSGSTAFSTAVFPRHPIRRRVLAGLSSALLTLAQPPAELHNKLLFTSLTEGLPKDFPPPLQLCIASRDDAITEYGHVEAFAKGLGPKASLWTPPSPSPHCSHYLAHPREYSERLKELLEQSAEEAAARSADAAAAAAAAAAAEKSLLSQDVEGARAKR
jgi:hypothetical protein